MPRSPEVNWLSRLDSPRFIGFAQPRTWLDVLSEGRSYCHHGRSRSESTVQPTGD
ncbi:TPA: hypothetical protein N0F65_005990 [Lagenidium giganteum]|uniref:Uncharacterized protein n=1 Tax=Lagenidium giganteum TaxID=4803 RepID=A0AAV2Z7K7_9STRA|nr:TPA: hypothetical protein N0F65_005990 [Lagenidium giganteum]